MPRNDTAVVCSSPFAPVGVLFLDAADSGVREVLEQAHAVIVEQPELVALVDADLDAHARRKKALREADRQWHARRQQRLDVGDVEVPDPDALELLDGRPRTPAYVVLLALVLRGYLGAGFKDRDICSLLAESVTLRTLYANVGVTPRKPSTLGELVNAVSVATRERILTAQAEYVLRHELDDFRTLLGDSTHVRGNTAWPTDSRLIVTLAERALRVVGALPELGLPKPGVRRAHKQVLEMRGLDRQIGLAPAGKGRSRTRRRCYSKLITRARRTHTLLEPLVATVQRALDQLDAAPSRRLIAERVVAQLAADVAQLTKATDACQARVIDGEKVPMAEKTLSVCDPDAAYIAKGQREAVIGYKPQIARSANGFITALLVPRGNASDSTQLLPLVNEATTRTGVELLCVSVDDGYASKDNHTALTERGIDIVSINGAKGKKLTTDDDWNSDEYSHARDMRSAIESLMYTIKQGFTFGEVARRGLDAVTAELLEKAIAHNLCNIARIRKKRHKQHQQRQLHTAALAA